MDGQHDSSPRQQLGAVLVFTGLVVLALHRLGAAPWFEIGWTDLPAWLATTQVEDVIVALLRQVALACAYWVLGSTVLYLVARASRLPRALRAVAWCAPAGVRRIVDRAVAVGLMGSVLTSGPVALAATPALDVRSTGTEVVGTLQERAPAPSFLPPAPRLLPDMVPAMPAMPASPPGRLSDASATTAESAATDHHSRVVGAGESLWSIAEDTLAVTWGHAPRVEEISSYWRTVIARNASDLRSGDPDLIYAGEVLHMPHPPAEAGA